MSDTELDREFFVASRLQKAHQFARLRAKRGVLSLSLSLATGLVFLSASVALAAHFDVPNGIQAFTQTSVRNAQALVRGTLDGTQTALPHAVRRTQQIAAAAFSAGAGAFAQNASSASGYFHSLWSRVADTLSTLPLSIANAIPGNTATFSRNAGSAQAASAALALAESAQSPQIVSTTTSLNLPRQSATTTVVNGSTLLTVNNYITQPVIERTVQTVLPPSSGYVTQAELANQLNALSNTFNKTMYGTTYPAPATSYASGGVFNAIALSNKIDNLSGTKLSSITVSGVSGLTDADIPDGITASNYLALTGGTLSGDLVLTGNLTVSGAQTLSGAITIPYLTATSSIASSFVQASSTRFSIFDAAYFGGTATTTINNTGSITLPAAALLTAPYASSTALSVSGTGYFGTASTTNVIFTNATGTSATTTNFFSTNASSTNLHTSNLFVASLSGFLKATAGAVANALVNLASDVTGILPVANGGTGWANFAAGSIPYGNGAGAFATTTAGTAGYVLAYLNGVPTWTATSTLADISGTLAVTSGGTGQTAFGQGWLNSNGATLSASTSPTVNYITATSTTQGSSFAATTTAPYLALSQLGSAGAPALTFSGNANTGVFSPTANALAWTTGGVEKARLDSSGNFLIGTTTPGRALTVFNTSANPQQRISYDATRYSELYADASGALNLTATGKILNFLDGNLYLCDGGACPTTPVQGYPSSFTSNGNLVAGGTIYAGGFGPATCPSGMIPVPPSPADGTNGFCVDKYEAQSSSGNEVSVQGGSPWVSITQTSARAECIRAGKHLITEKEWQTIAHNAENVGWNWNGGVAGTNQMSDGHSDNAPASALATAADTDPCNGTGQTCDTSTWSSQRRTYKLSNGQYIWDLGGNVWEWVDQTVTNDYPIVNSAAAGWQVCSTSGDGICGNTRTTNDQWYRGGFATIAGFLRGGSWSHGAIDGAFSLYLGAAPSLSGTNVGFRCSR